MSDASRPPRPPRVLLVSPEYPPTPGGVGDYTALLARHLAAEGATVAVLTGGTGADTTEDGVRVLRAVPHWRWGLARRIGEATRVTGAEIVHIQYQTGMYAMHPAVNLLPPRLRRLHLRSGTGFSLPIRGRQAEACPATRMVLRVVTTFHDLLPPYLFPKAGPLRDGVTRLLACTSDAAIATNGADMATLRRWGVRAALVPIGSNIPFIVNGLPVPGEYERFRARYGIPIDATLLATFGLINQSKGLDTIIDALALLRDEGMPAFLLVVGAGAGANDATNRATESAFRGRIMARGLAAHVAFTGPLAAGEVARTLAYCDACVLPYRDGASPRRGSLLAALAQGIVVITTPPQSGAYDGLPPLTDAGVVFVPPDDAAVAAAVRRGAAEPPAARAERGHAAMRYIAHFDWGAIARRTLAVYRGERHTVWAADETGR